MEWETSDSPGASSQSYPVHAFPPLSPPPSALMAEKFFLFEMQRGDAKEFGKHSDNWQGLPEAALVTDYWMGDIVSVDDDYDMGEDTGSSSSWGSEDKTEPFSPSSAECPAGCSSSPETLARFVSPEYDFEPIPPLQQGLQPPEDDMETSFFQVGNLAREDLTSPLIRSFSSLRNKKTKCGDYLDKGVCEKDASDEDFDDGGELDEGGNLYFSSQSRGSPTQVPVLTSGMCPSHLGP